MSDINITPNSPNTVTIQNADNIITVTDTSKHTEVDITQEITDIVNVVTPGPQGPQGIQGPAGQGFDKPFTGSLIVSGSFEIIGDQTISGSLIISGSSTFTNIGPAIFSGSVTTTQGFTGSLSGTASYADMATTASHALFAVSASHEVVKEVSSSHANTADVANGLQGQPSIYVTNITASGGISSSNGTITAITGSFNHLITDDDTIEFRNRNTGVQTGRLKFDASTGLNVQNAAGARTKIRAGRGEFLSLEAGPVGLNSLGSITASGDISSSTNIIAKSFIGTFSGGLSGSAQIASDISGAFTAASASFSTRITANEIVTSKTLISSSAQIASNISGAFSATSSSLASRTTTLETKTSYSGSFSGSFEGNGSGLTNIPASGITGLNLSQIASGSATASISPNNGFKVNTNTQITGSLNISGSIDISMPTGSVFTIHEPDVDQPNRLDFSYGSGDPTLTIGSRSNQGYLHLRKGFTGTGLKIGSDGTFAIGGTITIQLTSTQFKPNATNTIDLGVFNRRFKDVFLYSGAKLGWSANTLADLVSFQHIAGTNTLQATGSSDVTLDVKGDLNVSTNITASGNVSSSITSTASFGTYLGDGSQLTGIETDPFPYTGSAIISGSLDITGSLGVTGNAEFTNITSSNGGRFESAGSAGEFIIKNAGNDADAFTVYMTDGTGTANIGAYGGIQFISRYGSTGTVASYNNLGTFSFNYDVNIASGKHLSGSATSTASFGTYLGDGSQLTGIEGGAGFPFSGSAVITGSLVVSGSLVDFTSASSVLLNIESIPLVNPIVEYITTSAITSSGTTVPLPNALTFVSSSTYEYLEVFINGLRMRYDMDFIPASTASVTYQITVPSGAEVTYKSLKRP